MNLTGTDSTAVKATRLDLLRDSVYLYTKEVYLWNTLLPGYAQFNPRQYSGATEIASATNVMNGVRALQPLDRFSFVTSTAAAAGLQTGEDVDLGFLIKPASIDRAYPIDSVYWFVNYVYASSPAGKAGVQRGMMLSKINTTKLDYSNATVAVLNDIFYGATTSASFQFIKADGTALGPITLTKASYVANSVLYRTVLTSGAKKVGYVVFNQFFAEPSRKELGDVFTYFSSQGITDLVVDLRYNGGGSTGTQDTLANLIAPLSANNKTMYQYLYNETLQKNEHQLIKKSLGYGNIFSSAGNTQVFKKAGSLNLSRVFFIVTGSTASASELLINNLKPYMNVQIIGDTTYGKP
ncbi:MAG: S41 family peptidase, partial [Chitinophagaceae bacterium]